MESVRKERREREGIAWVAFRYSAFVTRCGRVAVDVSGSVEAEVDPTCKEAEKTEPECRIRSQQWSRYDVRECEQGWELLDAELDHAAEERYSVVRRELFEGYEEGGAQR